MCQLRLPLVLNLSIRHITTSPHLQHAHQVRGEWPCSLTRYTTRFNGTIQVRNERAERKIVEDGFAALSGQLLLKACQLLLFWIDNARNFRHAHEALFVVQAESVPASVGEDNWKGDTQGESKPNESLNEDGSPLSIVLLVDHCQGLQLRRGKEVVVDSCWGLDVEQSFGGTE